MLSHSVVSNSLWPHELQPIRSSVYWILQARILEWVAKPSSRESSQPRDRTQVSRITGRFFTNWATREVQLWKWKARKKKSYRPVGHPTSQCAGGSLPCWLSSTNTCFPCRHIRSATLDNHPVRSQLKPHLSDSKVHDLCAKLSCYTMIRKIILCNLTKDTFPTWMTAFLVWAYFLFQNSPDEILCVTGWQWLSASLERVQFKV